MITAASQKHKNCLEAVQYQINNQKPDMNTTSTINELLNALREQKETGMKGGIYHKTQIDLTYNSNHIEGSRLTHEQTRYIFETNTIGLSGNEAVAVNVNDIIETQEPLAVLLPFLLHF